MTETDAIKQSYIRDAYKNKGLSGLTNLGNTCFLNSVMQVLSHTYELNEFLNKKTYSRHLRKIPESVLIVEWDSLRQLMWQDNHTIAPSRFVGAVQTVAQKKDMPLFSGFNQNDTSEFLIFVIDCFHASISREVKMNINGNVKGKKDEYAMNCFTMIKQMYEKDYSEIWAMFYGTHISQLEDLDHVEMISSRPEPFFIINLSIPSNTKTPTLYDCFDKYIEGEILDEDNGVFSEKYGKKVRTRKTLDFWSLPDIMVIDIKRFNAKNQKNQILVDFPLEKFDLSKYVVGYEAKTCIYDLYGVCNHSGSSLGGHYTAHVKNANGKWYHFNDSSVSELVTTEKIITPKAYCFFYRKIHK